MNNNRGEREYIRYNPRTNQYKFVDRPRSKKFDVTVYMEKAYADQEPYIFAVSGLSSSGWVLIFVKTQFELMQHQHLRYLIVITYYE